MRFRVQNAPCPTPPSRRLVERYHILFEDTPLPNLCPSFVTVLHGYQLCLRRPRATLARITSQIGVALYCHKKSKPYSGINRNMEGEKLRCCRGYLDILLRCFRSSVGSWSLALGWVVSGVWVGLSESGVTVMVIPQAADDGTVDLVTVGHVHLRRERVKQTIIQRKAPCNPLQNGERAGKDLRELIWYH